MCNSTHYQNLNFSLAVDNIYFFENDSENRLNWRFIDRRCSCFTETTRSIRGSMYGWKLHELFNELNKRGQSSIHQSDYLDSLTSSIILKDILSYRPEQIAKFNHPMSNKKKNYLFFMNYIIIIVGDKSTDCII